MGLERDDRLKVDPNLLHGYQDLAHTTACFYWPCIEGGSKQTERKPYPEPFSRPEGIFLCRWGSLSRAGGPPLRLLGGLHAYDTRAPLPSSAELGRSANAAADLARSSPSCRPTRRRALRPNQYQVNQATEA